MTQTFTQTNNHVRNVAVGRQLDTGTVAARTVTIGFTPRYVKIVNVDSGDMMEWYEGMAAASAVKQVAAGTRSKITSNGITVSGNTFIIGLDTDVNVTSEQISWMAIG